MYSYAKDLTGLPNYTEYQRKVRAKHEHLRLLRV